MTHGVITPLALQRQNVELHGMIVPAMESSMHSSETTSVTTTTTVQVDGALAGLPQGINARGKQAPCGHNSWDNVRVIKGQVTLRCRECQLQWRTHVDAVWRKRKCGFFNTPQGCALGTECPKIHMHAKKLSLEERIEQHGGQSPDTARASDAASTRTAPQEPTQRQQKQEQKQQQQQQQEEGDEESQKQVPKVQYSRSCPHNSWDNVRVKKGLVTLRCRECQMQWRQSLNDVDRCQDFPECQLGAECEKLHMHVYKQTAEQRHTDLPLACQAAEQQGPAVSGGLAAAAAPLAAQTLQSVEMWCRGVPMLWPTTCLAEGTQAWYDSTACYTQVGAFAGALLLQGSCLPVPSGSPMLLRVAAESPDACAMLHVVHDGCFTQALEAHGWLRVQGATPHLANRSTVVHTFLVKPSMLPNGMFCLPPLEANMLFSVFVSFDGGVKESAVQAPLQSSPVAQFGGGAIVPVPAVPQEEGSQPAWSHHTNSECAPSTKASHDESCSSHDSLGSLCAGSECSTEEDHHTEDRPSSRQGRSRSRRSSPRCSTPAGRSSHSGEEEEEDVRSEAPAQGRWSSCPATLTRQ